MYVAKLIVVCILYDYHYRIPSFCGLQNRLDCVYEVSRDLRLTFNCAKFSCVRK